MSAPLTAVVLPGLDGTGLMLRDFMVALKPYFRVKVLRYPADKPLGYDELLDYVRARLPKEDYIVIGESFSGPLALKLAQEEPGGPKCIVLGASFARLDLPMKRALSLLTGMVPPHRVPIALLSPLLFGPWATSGHRDHLRQALEKVAPSVLAARARAAMEVDLLEQGRPIRLPVLHLRATKDRLIQRKAAEEVACIAPDLCIRDIVGPHFLFQVAADGCAIAIAEFCHTASSGRPRSAEKVNLLSDQPALLGHRLPALQVRPRGDEKPLSFAGINWLANVDGSLTLLATRHP